MKNSLPCLLLSLTLLSCMPKKDAVDNANLPYPADEDMIFYQAQCDSGYQDFWTDIKAVGSSYLNNSKYYKYDIGGDDIIILGEGLFHGTVEVELPDFILEIKLEKKFKSKGNEAIWQVTNVREKPWQREEISE
jgi:hypothetical protein